MLATIPLPPRARMDGASASRTIRAAFRGLGNLGSKLVYLSANPREGMSTDSRSVVFTQGIIHSDEATRKNLEFLASRGFFPEGATFFVEGTPEDVAAVSRMVGPRFNVRRGVEWAEIRTEAEVAMDFTFDGKPLVESLPASLPVIVQSNNYGYGLLQVPPLQEVRTLRSGERQNVWRAGDCSLGGSIPVLARLRPFFRTLFLHFLTDRNAGRGAESEWNNTFYFSDSFGRRKSQEFSTLTGVPTLVSFASSQMVQPFYLAMVSGSLDRERIEAHFGSWARFERAGFFASLFESDPLVRISADDNTRSYALPPEPTTLQEFAARYPDFPSGPFAVYFRRTALRQNGDMFSFTIGFDVNLAAVTANLGLLDALFADHSSSVYAMG